MTSFLRGVIELETVEDMGGWRQSCSVLNNTGVISSKFINKFVQKCQCYYTLSDQSIPLVAVTSVVSLLTEQLWMEGSKNREKVVYVDIAR